MGRRTWKRCRWKEEEKEKMREEDVEEEVKENLVEGTKVRQKGR